MGTGALTGRAPPTPKLVILGPSERTEALGKGHPLRVQRVTLEGPESESSYSSLGRGPPLRVWLALRWAFWIFVENTVEGVAFSDSSNPKILGF